MIKCNQCSWSINEEYYTDDSLGVDELCLAHNKVHTNTQPNFTIVVKGNEGSK